MDVTDGYRSALVIEDDEATSFLLDYMLRRDGFAVHRLGDGRAAIDHISQCKPPRVVLLDLMLPYHDGFEILQRIRNSASWSRTPVIIVSGRSRESDAVRALTAGATDFVRKPYQPKELLARINNNLSS